MHNLRMFSVSAHLILTRHLHTIQSRWKMHAKACTADLQIPEGDVGGKSGTGLTPPTKPTKADASISISVDASRPLSTADKDPTSPVTACDATKPRTPILPRSAASFAGATAARKVEPTVLTMPRDEAWPRLLAYEVCDWLTTVHALCAPGACLCAGVQRPSSCSELHVPRQGVFARLLSVCDTAYRECRQSAICLSSQACLQVCIKAAMEGAPEAKEFLQDSCASLKEAFATQPLLLAPPAGGVTSAVAGGGTLSW